MDVSAYYIRQKSSRVTNSMPPSTGFHQPPALCKIKSTLFLVHRLFLFRFQKLVRIITPDFCFVKGIFFAALLQKGAPLRGRLCKRVVFAPLWGRQPLSAAEGSGIALSGDEFLCRLSAAAALHNAFLPPRTADSRKRTAASALTPPDERSSPCPHHQ